MASQGLGLREALRLHSFLLFAFSPIVFCSESIVGISSVIDGDTIEIHGTRIRLHGIDAPETGQECHDSHDRLWRCGQSAALALAEVVSHATISCRSESIDRYGRVIAVCFKGQLELNAWLVENGWAVAYRRYSDDYVDEEDTARLTKAGIWAGRFQMPWDWRKARRSPDPATLSDPRRGCSIKGNINRTGEKIYHVPGSGGYDNTIISESKGERWFCSEEAARDAGWRPPR